MWRIECGGPLLGVTLEHDRRRLTEAYDEFAPRVYAYATRHCGPTDADDVVAEVFAIAWRRRQTLPSEPLGWLLVTARNVISGHRKATQRRSRLIGRAAEAYADWQPATDDVVVHRHQLFAALDQLSVREREALLLVAWDALKTDEAAAVAGCTPRAFRARLTRARARLASLLENHDLPAKSSTSVPKERTRQ